MGGAAELRLVAAAIRKEGRNPAVAQDIARGLRRGRPRIKAAFQASVLSKLPAGGGLNRWAAAASFRSPVRTSALTARMNITVSRSGRGIDDMAGLDAGWVIHPRWGKSPWYGQAVQPGTVSEPIVDEGGNRLEEAVEDAADRVVQRIVRA